MDGPCRRGENVPFCERGAEEAKGETKTNSIIVVIAYRLVELEDVRH